MDANILGTQITSAAIAVWFIQQLKGWKYFPWLKQNSSAWAKRAYSIIAAIGIHTGISAIWNHGTPPVGYQYQLIVNIPSITIIMLTVGHWLQQFVLQELGFQLTYNRISLTSFPEGKAITPKVTADGAMVVPKQQADR